MEANIKIMRKSQFKSKTSKDELKALFANEGKGKIEKVDLNSVLTSLKDHVKGGFDHTLEAQVSIKLPAKNKSEVIRLSVITPNKFTKEAKVLVLTDAQNSDSAKKAGADYIGLEDLVEKIMGGWFDFDVVIATPQVMPKIAKLGKVLGPKGLMPSPKNETVTEDLAKVIGNYKGGKLDFKMNETGLLNFKFGKLSMEVEKLAENFDAIYSALKAETKKYGENVVKKVYVKSTMSPSVKIEL